MIKIKLIAVGKVKEKYFAEAIAEYSKRLSRYCDFKIEEIREENFDKVDAAIANKIMRTEAERMEKAIKGYPVALAVEGRKISSEGLADFIRKNADGGVGEICFLIGGSYGIDEALKAKCKDKISFSDMTFPHTLMRVMAAEQIYRAFSIINGSEYHK